jgi:uncharacterized damage-inducible protein DinB
MNATELIGYLTRKQVKATFEAARELPADKLDWKPAPGARSALDQLQELATAVTQFWSLYTTGKMEFDAEIHQKWYVERAKITDLDELERIANADTERMIEFFSNMPPEQLDTVVHLPFPGEYKMADIMCYHYWNASYHNGQITYIASLLEA